MEGGASFEDEWVLMRGWEGGDFSGDEGSWGIVGADCKRGGMSSVAGGDIEDEERLDEGSCGGVWDEGWSDVD